MRYSASEKFEIIELVQQSSLSMGAAHVLRWGLEPRSERLHDLQKQTAVWSASSGLYRVLVSSATFRVCWTACRAVSLCVNKASTSASCIDTGFNASSM